MSPAPSDTTPPPPRPSRRRLLRALAFGCAAPLALGVYANQIEPFWPQFHEFELPVPHLPPAFEGLRVTHLTDLHISSKTSLALCKAVVQQVNTQRPDMVFVTGDLVTHAKGYLHEAAAVVRDLESPTFISFGNHDYGLQFYHDHNVDTARELEQHLTGPGHLVLRNQSIPLTRGDQHLWLCGLDDLWSGGFSPETALAGIPPGQTVIALSHNPDTVVNLSNYKVSCVLSGHTHGGQLRLPGWGAILLPVQNRNLQQGLHRFESTTLYISRGIGYLMQARFACRPEVPTYILRRDRKNSSTLPNVR